MWLCSAHFATLSPILNLSSAENLARLSLYDRATEWHYFHQEPPIHDPPWTPKFIFPFSQLSLQPLEGSCRVRAQNKIKYGF